MTEREAFEDWLRNQDMLSIPQCGFESLEGDLAYLAWQAAITYERERCAMICQNLPMKTGFPGNSQFDCAEAIRKGEK